MAAPTPVPPEDAAIDNRPVIIELLKIRQSEAFSVIKYYEAALTVFLLITGGLLKFALDANATPLLRKALETMGIAICGVALLAAVAGERHRRLIREDIKRYYKYLALPIPPDRLDGQRYGILTCVAVFLVGLGGWIFLLTAKAP